MRRAIALSALILMTVGAFAQVASPADQARRLLESQSLRDKAWGAWFAGASHDPTLRERLLAQLEIAHPLRNAPRDTEEYAYIQALFDALIQMPGPIPTDVILPFEDSWRSEILILLSRDPSAEGVERALLDMREHSMPSPEWAAVNDLLFAISSKPFFQTTLEEIRITHTFVIADQWAGSCGGALGCGGSRRHFPKGFPPIGLYQLWTAFTVPGDIVFIEQPVAIHYRRIVIPTDSEIGWSDCQYDGLVMDARETLRARFFSALGGRSAEESYKLFNPRTNIGWQDPAQTASEMENDLALQAAAIQALIEDAQQRGLVQASGMRLTVDTAVQDLRGDRSVPLPAVAPHKIVIP